MRCVLFVLLILFTTLSAQNQYKVYFNEVRVNDSGTDDIEFIELIGPSGTDLSGFKITHFNGAESSDGGIWSHTINSFIIPDDGITDDQFNLLGFYMLAMAGVSNADETLPAAMQNGPDGLVLYDAGNQIIDAIAWQGSGDMETNDPGTVSSLVNVKANNFLHITVDDDASDNSLQAPNNGYADDGSGWILAAATPGAINSNQASGDISLPIELITFSAKSYVKKISLEWVTASEMNNAGFNIYRSRGDNTQYGLLASFQYDETLVGCGNSSAGKTYHYTDDDPLLSPGLTYFYKIAAIDYDGNKTFHGPIEAALSEADQIQSPVNKFALLQNYPNPFNPSTVIQIELQAPVARGEITIFDLIGKRVVTLWDGPIDSKLFSLTWNGEDQYGNPLSSGFYFYCFKAGRKQVMKKMLLLK